MIRSRSRGRCRLNTKGSRRASGARQQTCCRLFIAQSSVAHQPAQFTSASGVVGRGWRKLKVLMRKLGLGRMCWRRRDRKQMDQLRADNGRLLALTRSVSWSCDRYYDVKKLSWALHCVVIIYDLKRSHIHRFPISGRHGSTCERFQQCDKRISRGNMSTHRSAPFFAICFLCFVCEAPFSRKGKGFLVFVWFVGSLR